jgi:hypothetical protein
MPPAAPLPSGAPRAFPVAALTAFLHGIEPRAWVFGLCQGGEPGRADEALAGAEREFAAEAGAHPLAEWPMRFWAALLRQPALLAPLDPDLELARLEPGPRAALLLRLLASLDAAHAAEALGVSVRAYDAALGQAMATPGLPADWLASLREKLHALAHDMPAPTRAHLDELRLRVLDEAARHEGDAGARAPLPAIEAAPEAIATPADAPAAPRWPWFGLGLLLLVLLATLIVPLPARLRPGESESLPGEVVPPPPALSDTVIVTHPDYAQLATPGDERYARELALLSWYAASTPAAAAAAAAPAAATAAPADFSALGNSERHMLAAAAPLWPTLPADEREALRANAIDWRDKHSPQREALRQRLRAWDAQAPAERARRRQAFENWRLLPPQEQARVRVAAAQLAALAPAEQQRMRGAFATLDADTQRLWSLGPAMGQQLAPIAVLFAFLPEADRPALLDALRGLDPVSRAELSLLAPRLEEGPRQALRKQLLALPAAERAGYIHARLSATRAEKPAASPPAP